MALYKSDVHIDRALTNLAEGVANQPLVWNALFPELPVAKDSDKFFVYGRENLGDGNTDLEWEDGTDPPEVKTSRSTRAYSCAQKGVADYVTDTELRNSDAPLRPFQDRTTFLMDRLMLELEKAAATKATTQANYPAANRTQLSGTDQWDDFANSDPIDDVMEASDACRLACGRYANTLVIGAAGHKKLLQHPDIVDFAKRMRGELPAEEFLAKFFIAAGIQRYVVAGAINNTANEDATESIADVWGKHAVLAYVTPRPSIGTPSYGYTFSSIKAKVEREPRRNNAIKVIASRNWDVEFVSRDSNEDAIAGYLIEDIVS